MDPPSAIQENANQNPPRMVYMYFKKKLKLGRVIGGWMLDLSFRTWVSYHTPIPTTLYLQEEGGGWGTESGQFNMIGGHVWFFKITNEMKRKWSIFSTIIGHHAETNKQRKTHTKKTLKISIKPHSFTVLHHLTLILQYGMGERTKWLHGQDPTMFWKHVKVTKFKSSPLDGCFP